MPVQRDEVTVPSGGTHLAAWRYRPDEVSDTGACVVMAHGFSMTRHDGLEPFAAAFADAGAHVLCFDHRYLGDSGGEPRQRFCKAEQIADWRSAVEFARALDGVDPDRVALWGYSFSGGHCVEVAAADPRLAAVLLLCPFLDGPGRVRSTPLPVIAWILPRALADVAGRHNTIPVTGPPGSHAAMPLPGEEAGFALALGDDSPWRNEISPGVFLSVVAHRPWRKAARMQMPTWVGSGHGDISAPAAGINRFVRGAPDVTLCRYEADHFTVFGEEVRDRIIDDQTRFLARHGLVRA